MRSDIAFEKSGVKQSSNCTSFTIDLSFFCYQRTNADKKKLVALLFFILMYVNGICASSLRFSPGGDSVHLIILSPGHFHAALVQKSMYEKMSPVVHVYAPKSSETNAYFRLIEKYNTRLDSPTSWDEKLYTGVDYLEKMLSERSGNVVVLAGNNQRKTDYIKKSVTAGLNVLSDKPMVIDANGFEVLREAFNIAAKNKVLLYDIMTERYQITNILQKELSLQKDIFGNLEKGTMENPAVIKQSVHHFFKNVSGSPLIRPAWYYDVKQEGDGLVDVTTHLIDIIQWSCFPDQVLDYKKDINMLSAKRWPTSVTADQFRISTNESSWPDYLRKDVKNNVLQVFANGEMNYTIKGVHAKVSVTWNFEAAEGSNDTHYSLMRGTKANLVIRQGKEQQFKPALYIEPVKKADHKMELSLNNFIKTIQKKYPEVALKKWDKGWKVIIPEVLKVDHEAHFSMVTRKYLQFLKDNKLPEWEVPNMLAKYYTTTQALQKAMAN
ncbi:MAG: putative oxidoreductase C-terminal domain-containing protein [Niabella sp.]